MTTEKKVNRKDYEIFEFKEGLLRILKEEEGKTHSKISWLEFGESTQSSIQEYPYFVNLEGLSKIQNYTFPWRFKVLDDYTMGRRTLSLGLQIMRTKGKQKIFKDTATFSRQEYKTIKKYLGK